MILVIIFSTSLLIGLVGYFITGKDFFGGLTIGSVVIGFSVFMVLMGQRKDTRNSIYEFNDFKTEYNKAKYCGGCSVLLEQAVEWNVWLKKEDLQATI